MKYAPIGPSAYINNVWREYGLGYHFALAQMCQASHYLLQYKTMHTYGGFIIIDNGAAEPEEERITFFEVCKHATAIRADEVVVPDILRDGPSSTKLTIDKAHLIPPNHRMIVPQGKDATDTLKSLIEIANHVDFASIGIPKHLEKDGQRVAFLKLLISTGFLDTCHIHLLGCYKNPFKEIAEAMKVWPHIRGFDTAAPWSYAQEEVPLDFGAQEGRIPSADFSAAVDPIHLDNNMFLMLEQVRMMNNDM